MRTLLKRLLAGVAALVVIIAVAATSLYFVSQSKLHRRYVVAVQPVPVPTGADAIARGHHIALIHGCLECHGPDAGGHMVIDNPAMGKLYAPNLTHGVGGLKASYSTVDWVRAIRHGVGGDGRTLVLMPSLEFSTMSDADVGDLIAYLDSLPSVDRISPPVRLGPVSRMLIATGKMRLSAAELVHMNVKPSTVQPGPTAAYGHYLAANCMGCHNPALSGGKIAEGPPNWPPAANLTPGPGSAVAHWTEAQFVETMRTRRTPDGRTLSPVMPDFVGHMSDTELSALWTYLRTLPPKPTGQQG
ncbi:fructose dehydrogenase cytochrome subunit precursor [mine drainage metagenome]|uniref:Fructose dehydrogenase cytochrome subunit n=1 Tax=mine drainage metagenome TaxID=410659 RepID=A0A1J5S9P2_9ZZZZ